MIAKLFEFSKVYRTWQSIFSDAKIKPFIANSVLNNNISVLDLGCGPGTNAQLFINVKYLGVDLNNDYINYANNNLNGNFVCNDATIFYTEEKFDIILINSLMHHLDDESCERMLTNAKKMLNKNGEIHILDAISQSSLSLKFILSKLDRGQNMRAYEQWNALFCKYFNKKHVETYNLNLLGMPAYEMIYFKGIAKDE